MTTFTHVILGTDDLGKARALCDAAPGASGIATMGPLSFFPSDYAAYPNGNAGNQICTFCFASE